MAVSCLVNEGVTPMEEKTMLYQTTCQDERKREYDLKYFLVTEQTEQGKVYGVEIEKGGQDVREHQTVCGVSEQKEEVEQFLYRLFAGTAVPIELPALCDDFMSEREYDAVK